MELPLALTLQPSRSLRIALVCMHVFAALAVLASLAAPLLKVGGGCAVAGSLFFVLRRQRMAGLAGLVLLRDGNLKLLEFNGEETSAHVEPSTAVFTWLVVLNVKTDDGRKISIVLPADALTGEAHRRLRVWLLNLPRRGAVMV